MNKWKLLFATGVLWCSFNIGTLLSSCCIRETFGFDDLMILSLNAFSSAAFIILVKAEELTELQLVEIGAAQVVEDGTKLWKVTFRIRFSKEPYLKKPLNQDLSAFRSEELS